MLHRGLFDYHTAGSRQPMLVQLLLAGNNHARGGVRGRGLVQHAAEILQSLFQPPRPAEERRDGKTGVSTYWRSVVCSSDVGLRITFLARHKKVGVLSGS